MANRLKMSQLDAILALHRRNWSIRRIAKEFGVHRDTGARHIHDHAPISKQAGVLLGSDAATWPQQSSLCEPFRQIILDKLAAVLTAQRIYQDLSQRGRLCRQVSQRSSLCSPLEPEPTAADSAASRRCALVRLTISQTSFELGSGIFSRSSRAVGFLLVRFDCWRLDFARLG